MFENKTRERKQKINGKKLRKHIQFDRVLVQVVISRVFLKPLVVITFTCFAVVLCAPTNTVIYLRNIINKLKTGIS